MSKVVNGVVGIDVSNRDLESSVLNNVLKSLFGQHLSFNVVADSLNSRFGLTFRDYGSCFVRSLSQYGEE